ncbi:MAG: EAL domain-containing protein [Acidimicrobiales bacterium]
MRARLLAAALLPLLLVATLVGLFVQDRLETVRATSDLRHHTDALVNLAVLRARVFEERRQFEMVAQSASVGLSPAEVSDLLGMDVVEDPSAARAATDRALRDVTSANRPFPASTLRGLRSSIDRAALSTSEVGLRYSAMESLTVASLDAALGDVGTQAVRIGDVVVERSVETMADAVTVAGLRGRQIQALVGIWFAADSAKVSAVAELARSTELYEQTAASLNETNVVVVAARWRDLRGSGTIFTEAIDVELAGGVGSGRDGSDLHYIGQVLGDGLRSYGELSSLPEIASGGVAEAAAARGALARTDAERAGAVAVLAIAFALGTAIWFGRSITKPLRLLTDQVRRVSDGDLALSPLPLRGPRELCETSAAFNDVGENLSLIEQKVLALSACDFSGPVATTRLPGRLGEAFSASLQVLSTSVMERHQLQARLLHQATHDSLTGLANRRAVIEALTAGLARSRRSGHLLAVAFIDLDDFKATNDTSGHAIGDLLLQSIGERMRQAARRGDVVARLGGDEFVILAEHVGSDDEVVGIIRRVLDAIGAPISLGGREYSITASAGVVVNHDAEDDALALLAKADLAVYRSKRRSPSALEVYDDQLQLVLRNHAQVESALSAALAAGGDELELQYQPIVDATTGEVVSLEALVRWNRPGEGQIRPDRFISIAEASDLIVKLDQWVLHEALRQLGTWSVHPELRGVTVAVNVSGRHVTDPGFVANVQHALDAGAVAANRLVVEVTETALVRDFARAAAQIDAVRDLGVRVAVDDFGTGHTGLAHVRTLTVDELKIDRTFTGELPAVTEMVQIVMDLGRHLGVTTVAEGVETPQQADALRALGCTHLQGYLFSPALPPEALLHWVQGRARALASAGAV